MNKSSYLRILRLHASISAAKPSRCADIGEPLQACMAMETELTRIGLKQNELCPRTKLFKIHHLFPSLWKVLNLRAAM